MAAHGWVIVYLNSFDAGLRFPLPVIVFYVLADYNMALTQLTSNSVKFIIGFMLLCVHTHQVYYLSCLSSMPLVEEEHVVVLYFQL